MKRIYLDYASLTPIDKGVLQTINKYSDEKYANPDALYLSAINAKKVVNESKTKIAEIIHAHSDEIVFTSGGTESNRLIHDYFKGKKVIISVIEHSSIINVSDENYSHISVGKDGIIDLELLKKSITSDTALVSVILVNNEIGNIQPIHEISKIIKEAQVKFKNKIFLHTDACQAGVHMPLYVEKMGIDSMSLDGGKIYGPRGVGMLYIKRGTIQIDRPGTANVAGIAGFAHALEIVEKSREKETIRINELKLYFLTELIKIRKDITVNGDIDSSSAHILSINIPNIDNEFFVLQLDAKGVECSTKSACLRDSDESYVLKSIGVSSKSSVRFSFGRDTKKGDLKFALGIIKTILEKTL
jgi:cysteine desulfurase